MLSSEQKMGAILLFVFALFAVGLGVLQLRNTIYGPFVTRPAGAGLSPEVFFADERTRLQRIDTDQDGLNDYEELEFYGTSPYLPDTDSDGIGDKEEIDRGIDALCPEGQTCAGATDLPREESVLAVPPIAGDNALDLLRQATLDARASAGSAASDLEALASDPALLRQLLLASGKIKEEDLKKLDDATLLSIAKDLLKETATRTPKKIESRE